MIQDKIVESLWILDVTDAKTSGLWTMFLNCQSIKITKPSTDRFKTSYCIILMCLMLLIQTLHSVQLWLNTMKTKLLFKTLQQLEV